MLKLVGNSMVRKEKPLHKIFTNIKRKINFYNGEYLAKNKKKLISSGVAHINY